MIALLVSLAVGASCVTLAEGTAEAQPDPAAARACFVDDNDWLGVALVTATAFPDDDVEPLLARFVASGAQLPQWAAFGGQDPARVVGLIRDLRGAGVAAQEAFLEVCTALAEGSTEQSMCAHAADELSEQALQRQNSTWAASMTQTQRRRLRAVNDAFSRYRHAEADRQYALNEHGTARNSMAAEHSSVVRDAHVELLTSVIEYAPLPGVDKDNMRTMERDVAEALRARGRDESAPDARSEARIHRHWLRYRAAMEEFASSLSPAGGRLALRAALTRARVQTLTGTVEPLGR